MTMKILTLILAILTFVPFAAAHADDAMTKADAPTTVVLFYAENCGACKILDPKLKEAVQAQADGAIDLVVFDFSNRERIEATKTLAATTASGCSPASMAMRMPV